MLDAKFFVSTEVQEREVTLQDGTKHILYFKELPAVEFDRYYARANSKDENERLFGMVKLIVAGLCNKDGTPAISDEQAALLKAEARNSLLAALQDVNGIGSEKKA